MNICNCLLDLQALFCDIPSKWRKGIVDAICYINSSRKSTCECFDKCETLTSLSGFTLVGSILSINYKDENGQTSTSSVDLNDALDNLLDGVDPKCLMSQETWDELSPSERIQFIISAHCGCCSITTTTSTTTTTTSPYTYYLADEYTCLEGNCVLVAKNVLIYVPNGFIFSSLYYYQGVDNPDSYYQIVGLGSPNSGAVTIDGDVYSLDCSSFCPAATTTTSTSTSTTSSTTTTSSTSSTTTTTTEAPCVCHEYFVETSIPVSFSYVDCYTDTLMNVVLGEGAVYYFCTCPDTLDIEIVPGVTLNDLGEGCSGTTTTTTTTSSTTTTTTAEPTTTTTSTSTTTTSSSTTTTTTAAPPSCKLYQVQATPEISVEWEDCESGVILSTTVVGGGTQNICAREGSMSQTGGSGTITEGDNC